MTNETKQTAVDYLIAMKKKYGAIIIQDLEIAKEMEKEQMRSIYLAHVTKSERLRAIFEKQFEELFNETYGGNK